MRNSKLTRAVRACKRTLGIARERSTSLLRQSWRLIERSSGSASRALTRSMAFLSKESASSGRRENARTLFQCVCAFSVLYGISFWSVPAALIVGGLAGIIAMEVR